MKREKEKEKAERKRKESQATDESEPQNQSSGEERSPNVTTTKRNHVEKDINHENRNDESSIDFEDF